MLDEKELHLYIEKYTDSDSFRLLLEEHFCSDIQAYHEVCSALDLVLEIFSGRTRASGKPSSGHLCAAAALLIREVPNATASQVIAALFHDTTEDIKGWNFFRMWKEFNLEVAFLVWWVSKITENRFLSWEIRAWLFRCKIYFAPRIAQIIKLCDRTHNMTTLEPLPTWKQERMTNETKMFHIPLASRLKILHGVLVHLVEQSPAGSA